ncbi:MAG: phage major capsid protein, partial [Lentisphaeria bacterium]
RLPTAEEQQNFSDFENEIKEIDNAAAMEERMNGYAPLNPKPALGDPMDQEKQDIKNFAGFIRNEASGIVNTDTTLTKGDNGALVPATIANKIIEKVIELSPLYAKASKYPGKGVLNIPKVDISTDDITVAYATEFTELTSHSNKFASIQLTGYLYGALTLVSKSLLNNSDFGLTQWVVNHMAERIAQFIDNELINGTTSYVSGVAKSYDSTKMKVTLSKLSSVTADELINIQEKIPDVYQAGAIWVMAKATRTAIRLLKDGQNNYLLQRDFANPANYTLLGKPVYISENAPALGTEGNLAIMYGDFSALAVKEAQPSEIQILTEKYATQHAIGIVAWGELDAKIENTQKIVCAACGASDT